MTESVAQDLQGLADAYLQSQATAQQQQHILQSVAASVRAGLHSLNDLVCLLRLTTPLCLSLPQRTSYAQTDVLGDSLVSEDDAQRGRSASLMGEV